MADKKPEQPRHKLWIRVAETHAALVWVAIILALGATISLVSLVVAASINTIANPEVTDLSANFMTVISGGLGVLLGGLSSFLGVPQGMTNQAKPGEFPGDEDLVLDVEESPESDRTGPRTRRHSTRPRSRSREARAWGTAAVAGEGPHRTS